MVVTMISSALVDAISASSFAFTVAGEPTDIRARFLAIASFSASV